MHLDIQLALRWNLVEAATTSITLYVYDTKTIASTLTDTLETSEQTRLNLLFKLQSLLLQTLLFLTGFSHDVFQFRTLLYQALLAVSLLLLSLVQVELTLTNLLQSLANLLIAKLDFQLLELDFLTQSIILTVVAYSLELSMIALYASLRISNFLLLLRYCTVKLLHLALNILNTSGQTSNLVFQILNFERQLTS